MNFSFLQSAVWSCFSFLLSAVWSCLHMLLFGVLDTFMIKVTSWPSIVVNPSFHACIQVLVAGVCGIVWQYACNEHVQRYYIHTRVCHDWRYHALECDQGAHCYTKFEPPPLFAIAACNCKQTRDPLVLYIKKVKSNCSYHDSPYYQLCSYSSEFVVWVTAGSKAWALVVK